MRIVEVDTFHRRDTLSAVNDGLTTVGYGCSDRIDAGTGNDVLHLLALSQIDPFSGRVDDGEYRQSTEQNHLGAARSMKREYGIAGRNGATATRRIQD